jgi:hypothetical protein
MKEPATGEVILQAVRISCPNYRQLIFDTAGSIAKYQCNTKSK